MIFAGKMGSGVSNAVLGLALSAALVTCAAAPAAGWTDCNRNGVKDPYEDPALAVDVRVADLLARMTPAEKLGQLRQVCPYRDSTNFCPAIARGEYGSLIFGDERPSLRNVHQHAAVAESRLGIPLVFALDVIHGEQFLFPLPLALACSFDTNLVERAAAVAARESRARGLDWTFAPMCDVARDPRWGRVAEGSGEDPYLAARLVEAQVRGFQGPDPSAPDRIAACLKHFVGYSAGTGGRDYNEAEICDWTLRNVHLVPFRAGVRAGALTLMASFNSVDGIPAHANPRLLTGVLRDEWKFPGFVVGDWGGVLDLVKWGYARDEADAGVRSFDAGIDMEMASGCFAAAFASNRLASARLDAAVARVLRVKFRLGLFEHPYVDETLFPKVEAGIDREMPLARACVAASTVLLKNEKGILPLAPSVRRIALVGPLADDRDNLMGCWRAHGDTGRTSLAEALRAVLPPGTSLAVVKGCSLTAEPVTMALEDGSVVRDPSAAAHDAAFDSSAAVAAARAADVVVMALGEPRGWAGENASRCELSLTGRQQDLFDAVAAAGKPVVAVVFSGRPLALPKVWDRAAAVLYAWQPGTAGAAALADILVGAAAPSGRLAISVPRSVGEVPCFYNRANTGRPGQGQYRELAKSEWGPRFIFGYGLTYTTFAYSPVTVVGGIASATVTNTGKRSGSEVVQLYVHQRNCRAGWRPVRELRGFCRVALEPGASATVSFPLSAATLGYVARDGRDVCEDDTYDIWIAPDAASGESVPFTHVSGGHR